MRAVAALVALFAMLSPAIAYDGLDGDWCQRAGDEMMIIDPHGLGFNEHTVCKWDDGRPSATIFEAAISCANVYPSGNTLVTTDSTAASLSSDGSAPETINVSVDGGEPVPFIRCDP
jgi:hypothetical protein